MISEEEALAEKRTKYQRKRLEARMEEKKSSCTKCNCKDCTSQREDIDAEVKSMRNNAVNIEFLQERTKKLTEDVEKLIRNGNGH